MRLHIILSIALIGLISDSRAAAEADVAVGFAATYLNSVGGIENAEVNAMNAVAGSNAINSRSGSPARTRLVGVCKSVQDNTNRTSTGGIVGWLANYDSRIRDVVDFGNSVGADLVAYVCTNNDSGSIGAVAQQPGRYSAFNPSSFWSTVFAHETGGHNYGCDHRGGDDNPKTVMMHNYCGGGSQGYYTNTNIWLDGKRLLGTGTCLGAAVNGGDNTYVLSTAAQGRSDAYQRVLYGSKLNPVTQRWKFNKPAGSAPAGTVISDDVSGAQAIVRGQGAIFTGNGLRLPGGTNANTNADSIAAYIDLPNGIFSTMPNFTVEIWATPLSPQNWMRVIDIGRTTQAGDGLGASGEYTGIPGSAAPGATDASDSILLSAANGTNINQQRLQAWADGVAAGTSDSSLATTVGQMYHYAITFTDTASGGTLKWFRNGGLIRTLDVSFNSNDLEDVNNWLGRSMFSSDAMSHMEFHDVRIQGSALKDGQVAANYLIGPFDAKSTLWASDALGSSGFVSGAWEFGAVPSSARDYETGEMRLRTPSNGSSHTWPGKSLTVTGGELVYKGTSASTITFNDLHMAGGTLTQAGSGATGTIAGTMKVSGGAKGYTHIRGANGPLNITARIEGTHSILYTEEPVTLSADNTGFDGWTIVGDGRFSTLIISSEENLGRNPPWFAGDWLSLNRGILQTYNNVTLDDSNRCVEVGTSGAIFRPLSNTTLTIATPLTCNASGNTLRTAPLDSNPIAGRLIKEWGGVLNLTHPNNSHNGEIELRQGELRVSGEGRLNNGSHWMPFLIDGNFNYDSERDQIVRGEISGNGAINKGNSGTLSVNGSNSFSGSVTVNDGTLYANPGNAASDRAFSYVSGIIVNSGGRLRAGPNGLFGWNGTQERPIVVNSGGTLVANGGPTSDVGVGSVTLNGGTLATLSGGASDWGSWRFDNATDKLLVTADSTASATHVKFGHASASIEVQSGRTLNFTGTVTDAINGGTSHLRKTGPGTLILAGANTYTGATSLESGALRVDGSLGNSAVTVSNGAVLMGTGSLGGTLSFAAGGIHSPGNPSGTQTINGVLSYAAGARVRWALGSNTDISGAANRIAAGVVNVTAGAVIDLKFNTAGSTVNFTDDFWTEIRTWPVIGASNKTGDFVLGTVSNDAGNRVASDYGTLHLQQSSAGVSLVFTPHGYVGTPIDGWRQTHFGSEWDDPQVSGDAIDRDNDGLSNLVEYALGTNPNESSSSAAPQVSTDAGKLTLTFTRNTAATDVRLSVMATDDLTAPWTEIARSENGAPFSVIADGASATESGTEDIKNVETTDIIFVSDPAHPKRFMKLEVSR